MHTLDPLRDHRTRNVVVTHEVFVQILFADFAIEFWIGNRDSLIYGPVHCRAHAHVAIVFFTLKSI